MGCCASVLKRRKKAKGSDLDGPVKWYPPGSQESNHWLDLATGFGYGRNKSFRFTAQPLPEANRHGNQDGELAGKIIFYKRACADTNYSYIPENPVLTLKEGDRLYAKAFLSVPMNRIPIGENNLPYEQREVLCGRGATLFASKPRVIALFVDVDGIPQKQEHFCQQSDQEARRQYNMQGRVNPLLPGKAVLGSFLTYCTSKEQDPFFFIHLPLIGTLHDTIMSTGHYGETMIRAFCSLIESLEPGTHTLDFRLFYWYDHLEYDYYVLRTGPNPLGKWRCDLTNEKLKTPHPKPYQMVGSSGPIASGQCTIFLPEKFENMSHDLLDMKPPPEVYAEMDAEHLRKVARVVAAGKFCESMGLCGLPDWVVLNSPIYERSRTEPKSGRQVTFDVLDFSALWLNETDPMRPDAAGYLVEGCMAKGDIGKDHIVDEWIYVPPSKNGVDVAPKKFPVKNKYINICRKGRRFSILSAHRGSMSLATWSKYSGLPLEREETISESPEMR